jgi:CRP-like cAMP-binding protein
MQIQSANVSFPFASPTFDNWAQQPPARQENAKDPLDAIGAVVSVKQGAELYAEGDPASYLYRVTAGVLRTCKLLPDGRRQIDDFLFPGDFFGLEGLGEHGFAAEAVTNASVVRYSRARLDLLAMDDARLCGRLLQLTLKRLGKAHGRVLLLGRKTAEEKLASFLLEMLDNASSRDAIDLPMSRTDIADYLGLTIETVSRTFSALKQEGVIALPSAHRIVVADRSALEELSGDV